MSLRARFRISVFVLAALAGAGFAACGDTSGDPHRAGEADGALPDDGGEAETPAEIVSAIPVTSPPDVQSRVITAFVSTRQRGTPSSWSVSSLFSEQVVDNYGAVVMAAALAGELGWEWQTVVLDCQPGTRWFLEVNTYDGRFLLDPYDGRIVTMGAADAPALPFPEAFQTGTLYRYTGSWPTNTQAAWFENWVAADVNETAAWRSGYAQACLASRYTPSRALQFPIVVDASQPYRTYGIVNQSPWDVDQAFAAPGQTRSDHAFWGGYHSPAGPIVFGYRLILTNTVAGLTYRFSFRATEDYVGTLVAVSADADTGGFKRMRAREYTLAIVAKGSRAEVSLGMNSLESLAIDAMAIGAFAEGDWP